MKTILTRGPIEHKWGYFYELYTDNRDPEFGFDDIEVDGKMSIETKEDREEGLVLTTHSHVPVYYGFCCKENKLGLARCHFHHLTGHESGSIAWGSSELVCEKDLAIALATSGLIGIRIEKIESIDYSNGLEKDWFHITSARADATLKSHPIPAGYTCWKCNIDPICKKCGIVTSFCPNCGERIACQEPLWKGPGDLRMVYDPGEKEHPYNAIDPQLWDGADFFKGIISHRMYLFLLAQKAHPFRVIPVPINAHNIQQANLNRLEQARTPLS